MKWFYPETVNNALNLLHKGYTLHSGGTGLLMGGKKHTGFIHLKRIGELNKIKMEGDKVEVGGMVTYSQLVEFWEENPKGNVLKQALSMAATTPLRNRITVGGSLGFLPSWSDLIGPLVALEGKIKLEGKNQGVYDAMEFVKKPSLKKNSIITTFLIPKQTGIGLYFRGTRTAVDFADFTISVVKKTDSLSIVVTGTREKVSRLYELEERISKTGFDNLEKKVEESFKLSFSNGRLGTAEYRSHLVKIWLIRLLEKLEEKTGNQY